jgi:hypothetical protein
MVLLAVDSEDGDRDGQVGCGTQLGRGGRAGRLHSLAYPKAAEAYAEQRASAGPEAVREAQDWWETTWAAPGGVAGAGGPACQRLGAQRGRAASGMGPWTGDRQTFNSALVAISATPACRTVHHSAPSVQLAPRIQISPRLAPGRE